MNAEIDEFPAFGNSSMSGELTSSPDVEMTLFRSV